MNRVEFKPHPYQAKAIDWIQSHPRCGLFLPMGAGKTVSTLTAINEMLYMDISHVLIIGPVRVVQSTWPDEISKWNHTSWMKYQIIEPKMAKGKKDIDTDVQIHLVGKENVTSLCETFSRDWMWDMVVIDELSTFKNPQSQRFKSLRKMVPLCERFVGLTGTPAPNGIPDIWSQIYLMDRGERLGKTLGMFRSNYLIPGRRNGFVVYNWKLQEGAEDRIYEKISDICMSIKQGDCTKLPPLSIIDYSVDLGNKIMKQYREFQREKVLELGDDESVIASNAGVLCGQLLQMASGEIYTEEGTEMIHSKKLEALEDLIESANSQPVMVFYYYKHELKRIVDHFSKMGKIVKTLDGADDVRAWNNGEIEILLLHPASAGHGLNLQSGGNIAIWYSLPNWNLELYQQANARIYRQGQKKAVSIYHILARETIDQDMIKALNSKEVTQQKLIDALRREIQ